MGQNNQQSSTPVIALSGGVGGAKLALGLSKILQPDELTVVANTADDFEHLGLPISPDIDTLMYTLAGRNNTAQGWGLAGESWNAMQMLQDYGADTWFQLGDRDLVTHLLRRQLLDEGNNLTQVTRYLCQKMGVEHPILPMSNDKVSTRVYTQSGELSFQHYFVRERCEPVVTGFGFAGIESAVAQPDFIGLLASSALQAVIICPSNPFVSVRPMLELSGVSAALKACNAPVIAVSPIVAGEAIKGPTAKMLRELNMPCTVLSIAEYYKELIDGLIIDKADAHQATEIEKLGIAVEVAPTVMRSLQDRVNLANISLNSANRVSQQ